jgi:hypothetical protein
MQDECELVIKKTGATLGRVALVYETYPDGAMNSSDGELVGISMAKAEHLAAQLTRLILRRITDGRTAEVTITESLPDDRATVIFDHAPFSKPAEEA